MTAKPTAIVVRLPLSEGQKRKAVAEMMSAGVPVSDAFVKALLAIGTPVAGGEFDCQKLDPNTKTPLADLSKMIINQRAALAAAQAENVRLREAITTARVSIANGNPMKAAYALEEALKGPAA